MFNCENVFFCQIHATNTNYLPHRKESYSCCKQCPINIEATATALSNVSKEAKLNYLSMIIRLRNKFMPCLVFIVFIFLITYDHSLPFNFYIFPIRAFMYLIFY